MPRRVCLTVRERRKDDSLRVVETWVQSYQPGEPFGPTRREHLVGPGDSLFGITHEELLSQLGKKPFSHTVEEALAKGPDIEVNPDERKTNAVVLSVEAKQYLSELAEAHGLSMSAYLEAVLRRDHRRFQVEGYALGEPSYRVARDAGASTTGPVDSASMVADESS